MPKVTKAGTLIKTPLLLLCYYSSNLLIFLDAFVWIGWWWGYGFFLGLEVFQYFLYAPVQLLVDAGEFFCGIVIDVDIRCDSDAFHGPFFAVEGEGGEFRAVQGSAVD